MDITWEVEDGYIGGSRPQSTRIPDSDFEYFETEAEAIAYIDECVQDDFDNKITWHYRSYDRMLEEIKGLIKK